MDQAKRHKAAKLLVRLEDELASCGRTDGVSAARESITDARSVLADDAASYKASDYAVAAGARQAGAACRVSVDRAL